MRKNGGYNQFMFILNIEEKAILHLFLKKVFKLQLKDRWKVSNSMQKVRIKERNRLISSLEWKWSMVASIHLTLFMDQPIWSKHLIFLPLGKQKNWDNKRVNGSKGKVTFWAIQALVKIQQTLWLYKSKEN